jgi:hypothetical protein
MTMTPSSPNVAACWSISTARSLRGKQSSRQTKNIGEKGEDGQQWRR